MDVLNFVFFSLWFLNFWCNCTPSLTTAFLIKSKCGLYVQKQRAKQLNIQTCTKSVRKKANIHDLTKIQKKLRSFLHDTNWKEVSAIETHLTIQNEVCCKRSSEFGKSRKWPRSPNAFASDSKSFCCQKWQFPVRKENYHNAEKVLQNSYQFKERKILGKYKLNHGCSHRERTVLTLAGLITSWFFNWQVSKIFLK